MNNVKNWEKFNESDMVPRMAEFVDDNLWMFYKHNSFDFYHHVMTMLTLEQKKELLKKINQGPSHRGRFGHIGMLKRESRSNFDIDDIIEKIKNGDLWVEPTVSGYFISDNEDTEAYFVLPYDDDPKNGWYISSEGGGDEPIRKEHVQQLSQLCG